MGVLYLAFHSHFLTLDDEFDADLGFGADADADEGLLFDLADAPLIAGRDSGARDAGIGESSLLDCVVVTDVGALGLIADCP